MYLHIAVPRPLEDIFLYRCPSELETQVAVGKRVVVPFGRQKVTGFILGVSKEVPREFSRRSPPLEIKPIYSILDATPLIDERMIDLCRWASDYYIFPIGMVLKTALSSIPEDRELRPPKKGWSILSTFIDDKNPPPFWTNYSISSSATTGMEGHKQTPPHSGDIPVLTPHQEEVLSRIRDSLEKGDFAVHLLHGVTGSGKTEIYMRAIEEIAEKGMTGIVLVPEIGITPQLISRFVARFRDRVAVLHSSLTPAERREEWIRIKEGRVDVVIGVRMAVFAPVKNLGLLVVDEEHEHSYKQEDGFRYNARDLAIMRAKLSRAVVILGSATPSLETYRNIQKGKYLYLSLPERINRLPLPPVKIVDMRKKEGFSIFTDELLEVLKQRIEKGEQSILFLNRRGFSPFLLCIDCGYTPLCPNCSVSLTYHKRDHELRCHYCDFTIPPPETCPGCNGYRFKGFGAGTERVEEELKKMIPGIRVIRMDRDTTASRHSHQRIFKSMESGEADVLIGTQMVTKGLDLPEVTLVGVLLADSTLHLPDFRSAERTFQFLTQVAGRSGRGEKSGEVIVQTFSPDHYSIRHAARHDFEGFYAEESANRKLLGYPPFRRLVRVLIKGNNRDSVQSSSERFKEILCSNRSEGIDILGPVSAPFGKIRGKYRWHLILKGGEAKPLNVLVRRSLERFYRDGSSRQVQVEIDVDPLSLL